MHVGSPIPRNPLDVRQKAMLPLDGPHVTSMSWTYSPYSPFDVNNKIHIQF